MPIKSPLSVCWYLSSALVLLVFLNAKAQPNAFNVSVGADFPELLNLGLRYEWQKYQAGLAYGTGLSQSGEQDQAVTADFWYHFMGVPETSGRKPGYLRIPVEYLRADTGPRIEKDIYLGLRIGRELMFNTRTGIRADAGLSFLVLSRSILESTGDVFDSSDPAFDIMPGFGLAVFYKF